MAPNDRSTFNFPLVVISDEDIDFSSIEKDFRRDSSFEKYLESIGTNPHRGEVVNGNCDDESTLPNIFGDNESSQISSFDQNNTLDATPSQIFEPIPLKELDRTTESQQIISDDEDCLPIEAFPDDESCICQNEVTQETPSLPLDTKGFNCDISSDILSSSISVFFDSFRNEKSFFEQPEAVSPKEIDGMFSEVTTSMENHNFKQRNRFRDYQTDQWEKRYKELTQVFRETGRSAVHHADASKKGLARWIKRQRAQYKLRQELKPSSMTDQRIEALNRINFVWDSHNTVWEDRILELQTFTAIHNHCNVTSSNYPAGRTLVSWIKSQRRQYRMMQEGKKTNLTPKRISQLESLGFQFS